MPLDVTTRVVEWNDLEALERALAHGDVACVLAEPALTNIGIVLPEPGFHERCARRRASTGTLLIIDETHTLCAGPGGYTAAYGLEPDLLTIGKPIAGGIPAAAYGLTAEVAERLEALLPADEKADVGGIGGTLAGNALSLAAMRATLERGADRRRVRAHDRARRALRAPACDDDRAPRAAVDVTRLGCRVEYLFRPDAPRDGGEAAAGGDARSTGSPVALNRGILMTPFHNMALMSPATTAADVDRHTRVFDEAATRAGVRDAGPGCVGVLSNSTTALGAARQRP